MEDIFREYFKEEGRILKQMKPNLTNMEIIQIWLNSDLPEDFDTTFESEAFQILVESYREG